MAALDYDYILVGAGLTGCVVASRLKQSNPSLSILLLEAGPDASNDPSIKTLPPLFSLLGSDLDWAYTTTSQPNTANRMHTVHAGKALGGGTTINFGGWSRGDSIDYDHWAGTVNDRRWGYEGLLPYFRRSESFYGCGADGREHGFDGPIEEEFNPAPGTGKLSGVVEFLETWRGGERQAVYQAYSLEGVQIITGAMVHKIEFTGAEKTASGILLVDGRRFTARKEHGIPLIAEFPEVGKNLINHFALYQLYKLRDSDRGLALGSPKLTHPALTKGFPVDWAANQQVPHEILEAAVRKDRERFGSNTDESVLIPGRPLVETLISYAPIGMPADGSLIMTSTMLLAATSRGTISISSSSATEPPVINPNYYNTETDHVVLIHGARRTARALLDTSAMKDYIECEVPPPGMVALTAQSPDADFDARIRATGIAHHHPAGTVAMGKVIDSELRVIRMKNLRVVDASVLPVSFGGHPQATLYAVTELAAEIILQDGVETGGDL
ncbi:hypothetical protein BDW74DRAFT_164609 [Aspergillus multicolor]|uniref:GMC family oxidoreductase n=1 Tax=Aspergillus multicolor TaxID=41759 RepID=UPI003CCDE8BC